METEESGSTKTISGLPLGTYTIQETKAPFGYKLDMTIHTVQLTDQSPKLTGFTSFDEPIVGEVELLLKKKSSPADWRVSVEGCEFLVRYYAINPEEFLSLKDNEAVTRLEEETPERSWVFKSDKDGKVLLDSEHYVEASIEGATKEVQSDELYVSDDGKIIMPIGMYLIEEIYAAKGLVRNDEKHIAKVDVNEDETAKVTGFGFTMDNKAVSISIKVRKVDAKTGEGVPSEYGTFKGATFEVISKETETKVGTLVLGERGQAEIKNLKPGTYSIIETIPPKGYVKADSVDVVSLVEEVNTTTENYDYLMEIPEEPIKVIINKVIFDENGEEKPFSGCSLELYDADRNLVAKWVSSEDGKEFIGLPKGRYYVVETKVPQGVLLNKEELAIDIEEKEEVQTFTFTNEYKPTIKTVAMFESGTKALEEGVNIVIDKVVLDKLTIGREYTLKSKLVDVETDEVIAEGESLSFTAELSREEKEIIMEGAFPEPGKKYVVYESLYKGKELVARHEEKTDKDQTVYIPKIGTKARSKEDDSQFISKEGKHIIVDTVRVESLEEGREYLLVAEAFDAESGEQILDAEGNRIYGTKTFTYSEEAVSEDEVEESQEKEEKDEKDEKDASGDEKEEPEDEEKPGMNVEVEVEVDYDLLKGKVVVFFETLYEGSEEVDENYVIKEDDIDNPEQTIYFPSIGTKARDDSDGDNMIFYSGTQTIVDAVEYKGLMPGVTYTQWLTVYDKETREPLRSKYLKKPVKAFVEFTPEESDGVVEVPIEINASNVQGKTLVMMEETMLGITTVATHFDLEDKNQTIGVDVPPEEPPKTGDGGALIPMFLLIVSTVCLSFLIAYRREQ